MTEKRFESRLNSIVWDNLKEDSLDIFEQIDLMNKLATENEQLRKSLKNSFINEICENCIYREYFPTSDGEFTGYDFKCNKKHFGIEHWKCDGLKECNDFKLRIGGRND